jgi:hypothetical protein
MPRRTPGAVSVRRAAPPLVGLPLTLVVALGVALGAHAARAGRTLDEPPGPGKLVRAAAAAELDKAASAAAVAERCPREAWRTHDLLGLECRCALATALVQRRPLAARCDLEARAALYADLVRAAGEVSAWDPLAPPPGLSRARFDAHRAVTRAIFSLYDELLDARGAAGVGPEIEKWLASTPAPKQAACEATQRTVELATGGDATAEERGAAQALLTAHACFLDESRLRAAAASGEPKPGAALKDSRDAALVAAETSEEAAIQAYAATRSIDVDRCAKHLDAAGRPKDAAKLEQCACGAIARWKLPARPRATSTVLPVSGRVGIAVEVAPGGAVARCGPLSVKP